eukprot:2382266-Alexandrium_andersonii.AAC.1
MIRRLADQRLLRGLLRGGDDGAQRCRCLTPEPYGRSVRAIGRVGSRAGVSVGENDCAAKGR